MIVFDKVSKSYWHHGDKVTALHEIDLQIDDKEIFGIIGESGSGKSTLLRLLNTLEEPDSGRILVHGQDLFKRTPKQQRDERRKTGMVFQQFSLLFNKSVTDNVGLPLKLAGAIDSERVSQVLRFVRMEEKANRFPQQLSGGERQRVAIARALVTNPKILLCDEPTSSLDGQHAHEVMELLRRINHELDTTIIIVSHELGLIRQLCSRAAILERGVLVETIPVTAGKTTPVFSSYYDRIKETL